MRYDLIFSVSAVVFYYYICFELIDIMKPDSEQMNKVSALLKDFHRIEFIWTLFTGFLKRFTS